VSKGNLARLCQLASRGLPLPFGNVHNRREFIGGNNFSELIARCLVYAAAVFRVLLASDGETLSTAQLFWRDHNGTGSPEWLMSLPIALVRAAARPPGLGAELERFTGCPWRSTLPRLGPPSNGRQSAMCVTDSRQWLAPGQRPSRDRDLTCARERGM